MHQQPWPEYDQALSAADEFELVVQVNGKVRDRLMLPVSVDEDHIELKSIKLRL